MIDGMDCSSCALTIEKTVAALKGVCEIKVSAMTGEGDITFDDALIKVERIIETITQLGYPTTKRAVVGGNGTGTDAGDTAVVAYAAAASAQVLTDATATVLTQLMKAQRGVRDVTVNPATKLAPLKLVVRYQLTLTGTRTLLAAATAGGYRLTVVPVNAGVGERNDIRDWKYRFWWSLALCVPVMVFAYILPLSGDSTKPVVDDFAPGLSVATLVVTTRLQSPHRPATFTDSVCPRSRGFCRRPSNGGYVGRSLFPRIARCGKRDSTQPAYRITDVPSAWLFLCVCSCRACRSFARTANMDTLVVLSTGTAYVYSVISTVTALLGSSFAEDEFFETTAVLITLIMFGRTVEVIVRGKATQILKRMMELQVFPATITGPSFPLRIAHSNFTVSSFDRFFRAAAPAVTGCDCCVDGSER